MKLEIYQNIPQVKIAKTMKIYGNPQKAIDDLKKEALKLIVFDLDETLTDEHSTKLTDKTQAYPNKNNLNILKTMLNYLKGQGIILAIISEVHNKMLLMY